MDHNNIDQSTKHANASPHTLSVRSDVTEVEVEPLDDDVENAVIPPDRRLSWVGWAAAIAVFLVRKDVGIVFFVALLLFAKFPTLNFKNLPAGAGRLYRKLRS